MDVRAIQRAAVASYLKLARLPFDTAISVLPDGDHYVRTALLDARDRFDATAIAVLALIFGDPALAEDARDRATDHDPDETERDEVEAPEPRPSNPSSALPLDAPAVQPPAAKSGNGLAADRAQRPPRRAASKSARRPALPRSAEPPLRRAVAPSPVPSPTQALAPSHEQISARAYELYELGVPGDAESHWLTAERELSSRH